MSYPPFVVYSYAPSIALVFMFCSLLRRSQAGKETNLRDKMKMAIDISRGMAYLEGMNFVHRVPPVGLLEIVFPLVLSLSRSLSLPHLHLHLQNMYIYIYPLRIIIAPPVQPSSSTLAAPDTSKGHCLSQHLGGQRPVLQNQ